MFLTQHMNSIFIILEFNFHVRVLLKKLIKIKIELYIPIRFDVGLLNFE